MNGSLQSGPEMMGRISARSSTYRAIGPFCVSESTAPMLCETICPVRGTRPEFGFSPAMPQKCAG